VAPRTSVGKWNRTCSLLRRRDEGRKGGSLRRVQLGLHRPLLRGGEMEGMEVRIPLLGGCGWAALISPQRGGRERSP